MRGHQTSHALVASLRLLSLRRDLLVNNQARLLVLGHDIRDGSLVISAQGRLGVFPLEAAEEPDSKSAEEHGETATG